MLLKFDKWQSSCSLAYAQYYGWEQMKHVDLIQIPVPVSVNLFIKLRQCISHLECLIDATGNGNATIGSGTLQSINK